MFPVLFRIGSLEVTSFGVMMALAFFAAAWVAAPELKRRGQDPELAWDLVWYAAIGGILGAKLYYMALHWPQTLADPVRALTSRSGLVWYGGAILAAALIYARLRKLKLPVLAFGDAIAPAMALGYAVGRMGCFLVGDDYGRPTDLPWGVAFPRGAPPSTAANLRDFGVDVPAGIPGSEVLTVHPTQLYEVAMSLVIFAVLWHFRKRIAVPGVLWFGYLAMAGVERFVVEVFRAKDDRFLAGLTLAQAISVVLTLAGAAVAWRLWTAARPAPAAAGMKPAV